MPRYMFLIKASPEAESDFVSSEAIAEMTVFNDKMRAAGVMLSGEGFRSTAVDGYRVKYSSSSPPEVIKGPFDVEKEAHVCGWWIIKTKDVEEALDWAKQVPFKEGELVIRRIAEMEDLGGCKRAEA
ncbi:hypothetical protein BGZ63DRAFT_431111 [Mariannaea sp. PMI_226]|nr:hypothetical protein BGZ63DRAFT_431111 [Mariannaea sp. PMI_226]